ncbi:aldo/keto reductase [Lysobacter sp. A03]|uniref:aldo/keto reductase n=1 Tax=Lysobacter sp. A03 TaxID=1199154 RepID=UPI0005B6AAB7|nr:aldo/keto reductase [Lysobacter sp. A03]KIQ96475.1 Oxidoreductase [Lysobacter sp. A03]
MQKRSLGKTGLEIAPLVLGGNVFGWTVDQEQSFALLDRFIDAGLDAIDTADSYSTWVPGNHGGESETIIGQWLKARSARDRVTLITKVGSKLGDFERGLRGPDVIARAEDSLRRLQTDHIDLYLSHWPDPATPYEETLRAYEQLIADGKVRAIGASNLDASQLREALAVADQLGLPRYAVQQPEYNLYDRAGFESGLRELCIAEAQGVITYYSLASGFLTGKYRSSDDLGKSVRGEGVAKYLDARGMRILAALDRVSQTHNAAPAEVALAWLMAREGVTAPIASATSAEQLDSLVRATGLVLSSADKDLLDTASVAG